MEILLGIALQPSRSWFLSIDYEDEDSDSDVPPEPPRQTKSGRLTQKPKKYVQIIKYITG